MKKGMLATLLLFFTFSTIFYVAPITALAATYDVYVSPRGNDTTGDGTINNPYLTITKARGVVRDISRSSYTGINVYLRGGEYFSSSKIIFGSTDSGTSTCPVTYTSYPGEKAIITGAKTIPSSGFSSIVDSNILNRISDTKAKQKLVEVKLSDYGIDDGTIFSINVSGATGNEIPQAELFFDNSPMTLSRWPNKSLTSIAALNNGLSSLYTITETGATVVLTRTSKAANDTTLNLSLNNGTCVGLTAAPISANTTAGVLNTTAQVETATVTGTITTAGNATIILTASGLTGSPLTMNVPVLVGDSATIVAAKIKTALTSGFKYSDTRIENWQFNNDLWIHGFFVGSGYSDCRINITNIDKVNKVLTTYGTPGYNMTGKYYYYSNILEEIDMPGEYYIDRTTHKMYFYPPYDINTGTVKMSCSQNILIEGSGLKYVNFNNLIFEGTRSSAINIISASDHINIDSCVIRNIGRLGVSFNNATDCTIKNSEVKYTGKGGMYFYGGNRTTLTSANIVSQNNHITDYNRIWKAYNPAVNIGNGVGSTVKNNLIHNAPHSAILFNGNDNIINQNEIYNVTRETDDAGAIYTGRDYTWRGNVISNNFIHDGRAIVTSAGTAAIYLDDWMSSANVYNNITSNFHRGLHIGGGRDHNINNNLIIDCNNSITFDDRNKSLTPAGLLALSSYNFSSWTVNSTLWQSRYPLCYAMQSDPNPGYPKGNTITNNAIYNAPNTNLATLVTQYGTVADNIVFTDDILLNDKANYNYGLNSSSPVYTDVPNFQPVDFASIGLNYTDVSKMDTFDLKVPLNNSAIGNPTNGVDFGWQRTGYADQYNIIIAKDTDFSNIVVDEIVDDNYCTISNLQKDKTYYWKVRSIQNASSVPKYIDCDTPSFIFSTYDFSISVTSSVSDDVLNVATNVKNNSTAQTTANIVIATYNASGKVLDLKIAPSLYDAGQEKIENYSYVSSDMSDKYFKIFVLDGFTNIKPLALPYASSVFSTSVFSVCLTSSVTNGIFNVVATVRNNSTAQTTANIVIATYNNSGKVLDLKITSSLYNAGQEKLENYSYICGDMSDKYYKVFVLDGFTNIKPLSLPYNSKQ